VAAGNENVSALVIGDDVRGEVAVSEWAAALDETDGILKDAARRKKLLTYSDLASSVTTYDLEPRSPELARLLCELLISDVKAGKPILASLVVGHRSGRPGKGYFRLARSCFRFTDDEEFWLGEVKASFDQYSSKPADYRRPKAHAIQTKPQLSDEKVNEFIMSFFD
jgi:hypothetical protein